MTDIVLQEEKVDTIIALLRLIAGENVKEIKERRDRILSVPKKYQIHNFCDGSNGLTQIANKVGVTHEYARLTVLELEEVGLVIMKKEGKKMYPKKVI